MFLGTASVLPEAGNDTASVLLDRKYLIDAGWYAPLNMLRFGVTPLDIEAVFITHFHQDHYLGLVDLIFYFAMNKKKYAERSPVRIYGPKEDIDDVYRRICILLKADIDLGVLGSMQFDLIGVSPGTAVDIPEYTVMPCRTEHAVPSLCYRFTSRGTGRTIAYTGDTGYSETLSEELAGIDLLIHEASCGAAVGPHVGHSGAVDAATCAVHARVRRLILTHCEKRLRSDALKAAKAVFRETRLSKPGDRVLL